MTALYPLRFRPIFKQYLWGGRRLETLLNKRLGQGERYAESWEVVDHGEDQSVVEAGPLSGRTLHELLEIYGEQLVGSGRGRRDRFPLLLKFLDAQRDLSVQVHPDDAQAAQLDPPDYGKTEAWYVIHADEGSRLYAGLRRGVDRASFRQAIERKRVVDCLNVIVPKAGDCIFIPAGTVHALGAGIVVAELQQSSDTTFRVYDWDRVGPDGRPRELHIEQALEVIDFDRGPVEPTSSEVPEPSVELVRCFAFTWLRWRLDLRNPTLTWPSDPSFHVLTVVEGAVAVAGDAAERPLVKGESMLVPAECRPDVQVVESPAVVLDGFVAEDMTTVEFGG